MRAVVVTTVLILLAACAFAYDVNRTHLPELDRALCRKQVNVPDIGEFKTLKCDFHIHTVFSDGVVWPDVRVIEAWRDGLDAMAITDHIEKHPRKPNITGDDNSSYDIAVPGAATSLPVNVTNLHTNLNETLATTLEIPAAK
ncbi:MAG: hypothetical protein NTZ09_12550 [Candidatus Hydrogenedentes bacterium]|nr:hypothetical protein [Candidatus Hydrogenedentota bacterium]